MDADANDLLGIAPGVEKKQYQDMLRRIIHLRAKEQERTASYSAISEEWQVMGNLEGNPLKHLVERENIEEILQCLTERQKTAVILRSFQQRTQREAANELGITSPAVSSILSQTARRLRKKYLSDNRAEKAVAAV